MALIPTADQLDSRKRLDDFLDAVKPIIEKGRTQISAWFSRPDSELNGWMERGRAIAEISDSMGYKLIVGQTEREIEWAREQLEKGTADDTQMRCYLKALRFLNDFILTTNRNADIASNVLAGRSGAIGRDSSTFVKNARVEGN
jgi:hypothetical protein